MHSTVNEDDKKERPLYNPRGVPFKQVFIVVVVVQYPTVTSESKEPQQMFDQSLRRHNLRFLRAVNQILCQ